MNTPNSAPPSGSGTNKSVWITFALFFVTVIALAVVIYLIVQPSDQEREVILELVEPVEGEDVETPPVNVGSVIDLDQNPDVEAMLGGRYRVTIRENSRDGSSGLVRIGGLVTFIDGASAGDTAVIEVTRIRSTTAQAVALSVEATGAATVDTAAPRPRPTMSRTASAGELVGTVHTGTVTRLGKYGDGAVKVEGKSIYVKGATAVGQTVSFRITREEDTFGVANLIGMEDSGAAESRPAKAAAEDATASSAGATSDFEMDEQPVKAPHIQVGMTYEVEVTGKDRYNEANGMTRIDDLVVIIPDTVEGDRVKLEIAERKNRYAIARVIERLPPTAE